MRTSPTFAGLAAAASRAGPWALFWFLAAGAHADPVRVEIVGVEDEARTNIRAYMTFFQKAEPVDDSLLSLVKEQAPRIDLAEHQIRHIHQLTPQEIRDALQPFGYYNPTIRPSLKQSGGDWVARYEITSGEPTLVTALTLQINGHGRDNKKINKALAATRLAINQRLLHAEYAATKTALLDTAFAEGYLDARFTRSELRVNPRLSGAEIVLEMDTGPRFYFGPVTLEQEILRPKFIDRFVPFSPGDPFDSNKLVALQLGLEDTEYFSEVDVRAQKSEATDQRIPVVVRATPNKPRRYTAGAGFGTDTGPRLKLGLDVRRVNRRGHQFKSDLQLSAIGTSFQAQYLIPIRRVATDRFALATKISKEEIGDIDTTYRLFGVSRSETWRGFFRQLYLRHEQEDFDLGDGGQTSILLIPGVSLNRQSADDPVFPRKGYSLTLDLHGGFDNTPNDSGFIQGFVSIRSVWPLGDHGRLLLRGEYGATAVNNFGGLPPTQRFFAGGDRSVRGYGYQDLAPANASGQRTGGKYLVNAGIELDYLIYGDYGAAVFLDAGNADNKALPPLKKSVGIGVRYRSPVGQIRVDFAHPLDDAVDDVRLHVSIGADL